MIRIIFYDENKYFDNDYAVFASFNIFIYDFFSAFFFFIDFSSKMIVGLFCGYIYFFQFHRTQINNFGCFSFVRDPPKS